ncbi:alpha/beta-hydrolase [Crepidotus variabilis]|uniref:Pheromone-processing carboxypeptidase KEX1 n=1 Tax=Crepidotus variabilis TaxID=179855 RepID=A0A9P6ETL0_9AGAR|nr:alpha/beta-hydrolase [Crepidotus variabilis]
MRCSWWARASCTLSSLFYFASQSFAAPTDIPSAASFYIPSIPHIHANPDINLQLYGGHLSADPNATRASPTDVTAHLYFFMVKNRRTADKQRVVFWFNGGPGCSSFDGLMMEVGPWRWDGKSEHDFWVKPGGWEEYTTMVYVDQPPGTGFSYTSTDQFAHTIDVVQAYMLEFIKNFYQVFPEYKTVDTYLAGESFAGQWIPYIADAMLNSTLNIPLRGVAIGNGWIDSKSQYLTYLDFATKIGLLKENTDAWKKVNKLTQDCSAAFDRLGGRNPMKMKECSHIMYSVMDSKAHKQDGVDMCINIYDVRLEDTSPACGMNWPPEMPAINKFLAAPEVVASIHASAHPGTWTECRGQVHLAFHQDDSESAVSILPRVLSQIPVLIFVGDQDLICNYLGLEKMIKDMSWNGGTGLGTVQTQSYSVNSLPAGTWATSRNLTYVKLFNASHMAPFDIPDITHDMMLRFMNVNFSSVIDGTARIPSAIGSDVKPHFEEKLDTGEGQGTPASAKTPQQNKAMWEAYYNAGSAALVLIIVFLVIGTFVYCRLRRKRVQLPTTTHDPNEENIPLTSHRGMADDEDIDSSRRRSAKGKERAKNVATANGGSNVEEEERIFDVGDSDDEDYKHNK